LDLVRFIGTVPPGAASRLTAKCARTRVSALEIFVLAVPVLRKLAETGPADPERVAGMQPHPAGEVAVARAQQRSRRVLPTRAERGDACAQRGVMLRPVAVPTAPHLVDPPLGD